MGPPDALGVTHVRVLLVGWSTVRGTLRTAPGTVVSPCDLLPSVAES